MVPRVKPTACVCERLSTFCEYRSSSTVYEHVLRTSVRVNILWLFLTFVLPVPRLFTNLTAPTSNVLYMYMYLLQCMNPCPLFYPPFLHLCFHIPPHCLLSTPSTLFLFLFLVFLHLILPPFLSTPFSLLSPSLSFLPSTLPLLRHYSHSVLYTLLTTSAQGELQEYGHSTYLCRGGRGRGE